MARKPQMWIMKITPDEPYRTEEIFDGLFRGENPKNVIGWSGKNEGHFDRFKSCWDEMSPGDLVVVMEGVQKTVGAVVITSEPYEGEDGEEPDWFYYRREAKLIRRFDPPLEHDTPTNRDRIIQYSGASAKKIMDEVWETIKDDYKEHKMMERIKRIRPLIDSFPQIILTGPPGTGKTYLAKQLAADVLNVEFDSEEFKKQRRFNYGQDNNNGAWALVQFHPAYNYEDFVRGIQVDTPKGNSQLGYETVNRLFGKMSKKADEYWEKLGNKAPKFVLIIDEINRANLPAVLGELIYGLEYRGEPVKTPYHLNETGVDNSDELKVPDNLYIIGTMNTADRTIGHIDYAVRRRFFFESLLPDSSVIDSYYDAKQNEETKSKALELFDSVEALFKNKEEGKGKTHLAPDFHADDVQVGHTYFFAEDDDRLFQKFTYQVYPLLREYYKDGILVTDSQEREVNLQIGDKKIPIHIHKPERSADIIKKLKESFNKDKQSE